MQTDTSVTFSSLSLCEPIQRAISDKGYTHPSPIQAKAIPHLLQGRDIIGLAQTGTGKTAAFSLPMLEHLSKITAPRATKRPRALVLTPTRELAIQIGENIALYGCHLKVRHTLVFGGVGEMPQIKSIAVGTDILVATPGRLLDLMKQRHVFLDQVQIFVLDEADRMLDMGFAPDVKRVIAQLPPKRQSLLFSATMPDSIREIANKLLTDPVVVEVAPVGTTADRVDQKVCMVDRGDKPKLLRHVISQHPGERVLVFARTKHGADKIAKNLNRDGIRADAIHGNKGQGARQRALGNFRDGEVLVLIATDIAARGIDVKDIGLVVNYDLPEEPEAYVHRIGRTARAGASGLAIAFCDHEERSLLRDIQKLIRKTIFVDKEHPFANGSEALPQQNQPQQGQRQHQQRQGQQPGRQGHRGQQRGHARGPQANHRHSSHGEGRGHHGDRSPSGEQQGEQRQGGQGKAQGSALTARFSRLAFWRR